MNKRFGRTGLAVLLAMLLAANSGCSVQTLLTSHLLSFGAGWLVGQSTVTATTECRLNGEPIDCAEMPD